MTNGANACVPLTLAIETSGAIGSVALGRGSEVLEVRRLSAPRRHAVEFLPAISSLCKAQGIGPNHLEVIAVSVGPGSFTGLRIGVTAARMIGLATSAKIVPVRTLDVIAQNALDLPAPPKRLAVLLDAKRKRVYASAFDLQEDRYVAVTTPSESDPAEFLAAHAIDDGDQAVLGEGVAYHLSAVERSGWPILQEELNRPRAETVLRLGCASAAADQFVDRRQFVPTYIRPPEAEEKWNEKNKR